MPNLNKALIELKMLQLIVASLLTINIFSMLNRVNIDSVDGSHNL